jgi:predicted transcriptional regulator
MKKRKACMLVVFLIAVMAMAFTANAKPHISKKKATIYVGQATHLSVVGSSKKAKWSSSNKKVATVNQSGTVTGKKSGKAVVTAKIGSKKYKCTVTVKTRQSTPSGTLFQRNALEKAKAYLRYSAFSAEGLVDQLEYEGFSESDARYAISHLDVNWNDQAVKMAKSYLNYSAFSKSGLKGQLEYEKFTESEAEYAVNHITVNWYDQAYKKAKEYLRYSSFSRSGLIAQLEYEGFTTEEAQYAVSKF